MIEFNFDHHRIERKVVDQADSNTVVTKEETPINQVQVQRGQPRPKKQPRYRVILLDDDHHSYDYVIHMMRKLFAFPHERAYQIARTVDTAGQAECLVTTREHAELKMEQIHSFGKDALIPKCKGSMSARIEPVE